MDGISLAHKVTAEHPKLQILMMPGFVHKKQHAKDIGNLIHDVNRKPFSLDKICHAVEEVLNTKNSIL